MRWFPKPTTRRKARHRTRLAAAGAALLVLLGCAFGAWEGSFEPLNLAWQSQLFQYRHLAGLDPKRAPIVIVGWDQNTYSDPSLNGTWDRATTGRLVDILHRAGARLIMLDRLYESDAAGTDVLAAAMRRAGNVVIAQELILGSSSLADSTSLWPLNPRLAAAARAVGLVNLPPAEAADPNARNRAYNNDVE
ncbi:MAG: CHASE2 domain-containing protein, partial [Chloroflexota bacterium]